MNQSYEEMNLAEKAMYHLEQAEHFQKRIDLLEVAAGQLSKNDETTAYLLSHSETFAFPYKKVTSNRDGHRNAAIMYGIVALLEKLSA